MSYAARIIQAIFWSAVLFLLTPSKITAIAYALVIGGLLMAVLFVLGIIRAIMSAIKRYLP